MSGGINYENPASFKTNFTISDPIGRCSFESGIHQRRAGIGGRYGHALHGRPSPKRRRPAARGIETGARPVIEENN